jgi:hypothetical protein
MKIDNYTRFLLTVIAICLVYLSLRDLIQLPKVHADEPVRVILVDNTNNPIANSSTVYVHGAPLAVTIEGR